MLRTFLLAGYALLSYLIGLTALLSFGVFVLDIAPLSIDRGTAAPPLQGLLIDGGMAIAYFALHSLMARPAFKRRWTRLIPPAIERSTYVLVSGLTLFVLMLLWQPLPTLVWQLPAGPATQAAYALNALGWIVMVAATFHIDHFAFFGLTRAWASIRGRIPRPTPFAARYLYALVRHPISLGWMIVLWATPAMSVGHLLLAAIGTLYIIAITPVEEADLIDEIGPDYLAYRQRTRAFLPLPRRAARTEAADAPR